MMVRKQCCEYWPALSSLLPLVFKYANIVVHIIQKEVLSQPRQESDAQDRFFFFCSISPQHGLGRGGVLKVATKAICLPVLHCVLSPLLSSTVQSRVCPSIESSSLRNPSLLDCATFCT